MRGVANQQAANAFAVRAAHGLLGARLRRPARATTSELEARNWNLVVAAHSHHLWVALSNLVDLVVSSDNPQAKGLFLFNISLYFSYLCFF